MVATGGPRRPPGSALRAGLGLLVLVLLALLIGINSRLGPSETAVPAVTASASPSATAGGTDPETGLHWVDLAALPVEARRTVALIDAGGPFPYAKDGAVFGNRERRLPARASGYYREYTVVTPGEDDRGARRIIGGDQGRQLFYTGDHYASFARIRR